MTRETPQTTDDQPFERKTFEYPTAQAFQKAEAALAQLAILGVELGYPKSEDRNEELQEMADGLVEQVKEMERLMAKERGLTEEERRALRGDVNEVFLSDG